MAPDAWPLALRDHAAGGISDTELAAAYIVTRVAARAGSRLLQGTRKPRLGTGGDGPFLDLIGSSRLRGVPSAVAVALNAWGEGRPKVHLLFHVPLPADVLRWQAQAERCVSLLPNETSPAPHEDGLAFALHDLCHLAKFVDPEHHVGQVGFFGAVQQAMTGVEWEPFASRFDAAFVRDLEHVVADMNGSAVFLFAALKMKLKMAVRRRVARELGREPRVTGALDDDEARAYGDEAATLMAMLGFTGPARDAAMQVSTRRDHEDAATLVLRYFEAFGAPAAR